MPSKWNVMTNQPWLDDEVGVGASVRQGADLLRRGLRRPWRAIFASALLAASFAGAIAFAKRDYAPRFVLRVVEADRDPGGVPRLKRQLGEYVRQAIFTSEPLFEVIRRYDLYPALMRGNPRAALDSFRQAISVDVYQNYFVEDRSAGEQPRSARVAVSYRARDRVLATAVTRDLGALIARRELANQRAQASDAATDAALARDVLQDALQRRSREVLAKQSEIVRASAPDPRLQVELVSLLGSLAALERQSEASNRRAAKLDLGAALEHHGIGLHFDVVEDATSFDDGKRLQLELSVAGASFLLGLPLIAMALGAFDPQRGQA